MSQPTSPVPDRIGNGAGRLRSTIIAGETQNGGVSIICVECGHEFVGPNPLTGESQEIDNVSLAKALWTHMCGIGFKPERRPRTYGR